MISDYEKLIQAAKDASKPNRELFKKLKKLNERDRTKLVNRIHDVTFHDFDCLQCANCCKTTGPLWNSRDIDRAASALKMKRGSFIRSYLKVDEDDDYVLKELPCPFLMDDNHCLIYPERPRACREYPHTDDRLSSEMVKKMALNAKICPAVSAIVTELKREL